MTAASLLKALRNKQVVLWAEGDDLHCNAPKGLLNATELAEISRYKSELIEQLKHTVSCPVIDRADRNTALPLSFAQSRLWFLSKLQIQSNAYLVRRLWHLRGALDVPSLAAALQQLVMRHEILRLVVKEKDGVPMLDFLPTLNPLTVIEDESLDAESAILRLQTELSVPMSLDSGPLFRAVLIRVGDYDYRLGFQMHHIVTDAWSMTILWRELALFYHSIRDGLAQTLKPLPFQFADFTVWQRQAMTEQSMQQQLDYWSNKLENFKPLELPADHLRTKERDYRSERVHFSISGQLTDDLRQLARRLSATPYILLVAALKCFLCRYTGQADVAIGTVISNRPFSDLEQLVGFFTNTLVLRTEIDSELPFINIVSAVRKTCLDAFDHQEIPFEKLVEALKPSRSNGRNALFDVMFVMNNTEQEKLELIDTIATPEALPPENSKFDLTVTVAETKEGYGFTLDYRYALFERNRVSSMARQFHQLLKSIVSRSDLKVKKLALLTDTEKQQQLRKWNQTSFQIAPGSTVHGLFEACAVQYPMRIAVKSDVGSLSYETLDRKSNQLAHYISELGIRNGDTVGILMDRSIESIVALLGILKAGAAFVPLDVDWPDERVAYVINDADTRLVLTQSAYPGIQISVACGVVCLDTLTSQSDFPDHCADLPLVDERSLAYILYTSGSTGKPKGVRIEHRSLVNYATAAWRAMELKDMASYALVQPFTADSSGTSIYCALLSGATLHLLSSEQALDGYMFSEYFKQHEIDVLKILPSHFEAIQQPDQISVVPRQRLILGGEIPRPDMIRQVLASAPSLRIFNHYGPTEASIAVSTCELTSDTVADQCRYLPVGLPLANCQVYVLDDDMNPVPPGVYGEMYLGGYGLAQGYQNRDDLTKQVFVTDPYGDIGDRLYRTGDIGYRDFDGKLIVTGRADHQVKIRGYRVEYEEVRQALIECAGVERVAVVVVNSSNGSNELVAFYTTQTGVSKQTLEKHARSILPDYMVPRWFVAMDNLPRISMGKTDLKTLQGMFDDRSTTETKIPEDELEQKVMRVWRDVLGHEHILRDDNFFDLGGHSLLATQLISHLSHALRRQVPLRYLFDSPTVADLVAQLRDENENDRAASNVAITVQPRPVRIPMSFAQTRILFMDQFSGSRHFYNMHRVWKISGEIDIDALERAFTEVVNRHEALRTAFEEHEGEFYQSIREPRMFHIDVLGNATDDATLQTIMRAELQKPFDLGNDLMIRATLFVCPDTTQYLMVVLHHIAGDAWSMTVLCRELSVLYSAYANGETPCLQPLSLQYADYSNWQREWIAKSEYQRQLDYWSRKLCGIERMELPVDHSRSQTPSFTGARETVTLTANDTARLRQLAVTEDATLFMILLCTFKILLFRYCGHGDITVGTPIAARHHREIENLIGFFSNTLVLRSTVEGDMPFSKILKQVKQTCIEAYEHQDMPFDELVKELSPDREQGRHPLFDVMMLLHNVPDETLTLGDLSVTRGEFIAGVSNFDLLLAPVEHDDGRLDLTLIFRSDLFESSTIARMLEQLIRLLNAFIDDTTLAAASALILGVEERRKLLVEFSGPQSADRSIIGSVYRNVPDMFEHTVGKWQDTSAVCHGSKSMTYGQLNEGANQLANHLIESGISTGDRVGVLLDRGFDSIVALIAILKCGAAYVPLDRHSPITRLTAMAESIALRILITDSIQHQLPAVIDTVIQLSKQRSVIGQQSVSNPVQPIDGSSAAYIMFTSGSTGTPKACENTHNGLFNLARWQANDPRLSAQSRTLQYCVLSFDVSLQEIIGSLTTGGSLIIIDEAIRRDSILLADYIVANQVERLFITSIALHSLLESLLNSNEKIPLRDIISTGDQLKITPVVRRFFEQNRLCRLHNHYGPVETHVGTALTLNSDPINWPDLPSIGKPIDNTRILILDGSMQMAPLSALGEICIAGPGVEGTYLNQDVNGEQRFTTVNIGGDDVPVYRTGDIGRYLPDGSIELFGRQDDQVKIRGYRVSLVEISVSILGHGSVRDASVVALHDDPLSSPYLVAYVILKADCDIAEVRAYLAGILPEYMIPSFFIPVDMLPRNMRSKLDINALPRPDITHNKRTPVAPHNEIQRRLHSVWLDIMPVDDIGVNDSFFDLGGHSLLAVRLILRINSEFNVSMTTASLFKAPSIALIAKSIENLQANENTNSSIPSIQTGSTNRDSSPTGARREVAPTVFTDQSLEEQIVNGNLGSVDSAAIGYVPNAALRLYGGNQQSAIDAWTKNRVVVRSIAASSLGRIASIAIPMLQGQLYEEPERLVERLVEAHDIAESIGAGAVSLVGVLPSTTNYGLEFSSALSSRPSTLKITTGHDITSSTIVSSIKNLLELCGRSMTRETVGFLGMGAIGTRALRLMLNVLPSPRRLILCDVYAQTERLETIASELKDQGYTGDIEIATSGNIIPDSFYQATLIAGATNIPDVLEVEKLNPGTLIVDDSAPHCFDVESLHTRFKTRFDVLFTEGGLLKAPFTFERLNFINGDLAPDIQRAFRSLMQIGERNIGGCVLSSLLLHRFRQCDASIGEIDVDKCARGYTLLSRLGFTAADPYCKPYHLEAELISTFIDRYGSNES